MLDGGLGPSRSGRPGGRGPRVGLHVCRGNWSRDERVLLTGDYAPLVPVFQRMRVDQFVLEHSTPRAGEIDVVGRALAGREIGLGVVNPRTDGVESAAEIIARVEQALEYFPPERIFLNPDCGFGCFANRCVNDAKTAAAKTRSMAEAAAFLRARHAPSPGGRLSGSDQVRGPEASTP